MLLLFCVFSGGSMHLFANLLLITCFCTFPSVIIQLAMPWDPNPYDLPPQISWYKILYSFSKQYFLIFCFVICLIHHLLPWVIITRFVNIIQLRISFSIFFLDISLLLTVFYAQTILLHFLVYFRNNSLYAGI